MRLLLAKTMTSRSPIRRSAAAILYRFPQPAPSLSGTLFRSGNFEVRIATRKREIRKAQRLRYRVFYEEGSAVPDRTAALIRRDICPFDRYCDHLLVIDHSAVNRFGKAKPKIVGAYRLLRQDMAARHGGFYSAGEFAIAPLLARHPGKRFLELGRSCVAAAYRTRHTLDLLWRGIAFYIEHYRIDVLFGCASFAGTEPADHAPALKFLAEQRPAPDEWRASALPGRATALDLASAPALEPRRALAAMPPLIKGYLRCGALVGDGVVVDKQFGTTDVFVVMPVAQIDPRYLSHFAKDERAAA